MGTRESEGGREEVGVVMKRERVGGGKPENMVVFFSAVCLFVCLTVCFYMCSGVSCWFGLCGLLL